MQKIERRMRKPFVFFDLGQTLVDEWDFISYFDKRLLEILNGYGARIDKANYRAVRDSVIRNRGIGHGSARDLVIEMTNLLAPPGYDKAIVARLEPDLEKARRQYFRFHPDAESTLSDLKKMECGLGVIANQAKDITGLLDSSGLCKFFKVMAISSLIKLQKPDPRIFELAMEQAGRSARECFMVGDRLDTDICPAKKLGMTTIRITNSLFSLQEPTSDCERPEYTVSRLLEIPAIIQQSSH